MHFERDFNFTAINETKTNGVCPKEEVAIEINAMKTKKWGGIRPQPRPVELPVKTEKSSLWPLQCGGCWPRVPVGHLKWGWAAFFM